MNRRHPAWSAVEATVYAVAVFACMNPAAVETAAARCSSVVDRLRFRLEALDTLAQIRNLPERPK
jgi:hypothetical protein